MTEFEKMRREEFYDFTSEECLASYYRAKHICAKLQTMTTEDEDYRKTIEDLIPSIPEHRHHSAAGLCGIRPEHLLLHLRPTHHWSGKNQYILRPGTMIFIIASILMAAGCWIAAK